MAVNNYIEHTDVDNWADGMTTEEKQAVIARVEAQIERVTKDVFYSLAFDIDIDGNGKNRLHLNLMAKILTVTAISIYGVTLSSTYWTYDTNAVYFDSSTHGEDGAALRWLLRQYADGGLFPHGLNNINIVGTKGWTTTPYAIQEAAVILCRYDNDETLYTEYIEGTESLSSYGYTGKQRPLTGIREADIKLLDYVRKKPLIGVV